MGVWLKNFQSRILFNECLLRLHCSFLLHAVGAGKFDVSVVCVSDKRIQHYNHTYRRMNSPTDVLSFPYHENLQAGTLPRPTFPHDYNLGDIILGMPVILDHCKQDEIKLRDRLPALGVEYYCQRKTETWTSFPPKLFWSLTVCVTFLDTITTIIAHLLRCTRKRRLYCQFSTIHLGQH